jgi:hypothetical protein
MNVRSGELKPPQIPTSHAPFATQPQIALSSPDLRMDSMSPITFLLPGRMMMSG